MINITSLDELNLDWITRKQLRCIDDCFKNTVEYYITEEIDTHFDEYDCRFKILLKYEKVLFNINSKEIIANTVIVKKVDKIIVDKNCSPLSIKEKQRIQNIAAELMSKLQKDIDKEEKSKVSICFAIDRAELIEAEIVYSNNIYSIKTEIDAYKRLIKKTIDTYNNRRKPQ